MQTGFDYFENKFWTEFLPIVNAFKAARLFNPEKVSDLKPTASTIDELKVFAFLENVISNLKAELAEYQKVSPKLIFLIGAPWVKNADKLPSWATAYKKIVLHVSAIFSCLREDFQSSEEFI